MSAHISDLLYNIAVVTAAKIFFVKCAERLRHIDSVQPDLIGINSFMPEAALKGPGLVFKLAVQQLRRFAAQNDKTFLTVPQRSAVYWKDTFTSWDVNQSSALML